MGTDRTTAQDELTRRQRSLIPLNLVVAVLALVAALSILFLPLLTIHIEDLSDITSSDGNTAGSEPSVYTDMLDDMSVSMSFTGKDLAALGFSDDPMDVLIGKMGESLSTISGELASAALLSMASSSDTPIDESVVAAVNEALSALEKAQTDEEVDASVAALAETLRAQFDPNGTDASWDDGELRTQIRDMYDKTVENTADGSFTTEAFICVNLSEAMGEEGKEAPVYTSFSEMMRAMLDGSEESEDLFSQLPDGVMTGFGAVILLFAGVWVILFLFAFLHMFAKNKRFTMWYVKLFGFFPCLIFAIAPLAGAHLIADTTVAAVLSATSSLAWVSGVCYLLLWLISVFWAFPIKRKIRKLNRELGQ